MLTLALTAAALFLLGAGILLGILYTHSEPGDQFSDEAAALVALGQMWEDGYQAAVEAFGYVYDPEVQ